VKKDGATREVRLDRWDAGKGWSKRRDRLAVEEPLEIRLDTKPVSVTMRTPGFDTELAAGYLYTEGIVKSAAQIARIVPYPRNPDGNVIDVFLASGVEADLRRLARSSVSTSSCGLCGKTSIDSIRLARPPLRKRFVVARDALLELPERMRQSQPAFDSTGGLHAAALFDTAGNLKVLREDIGRHNAVDKVIGHALLERWPDIETSLLVVSGRASFEILQKALVAGIAFICAVSAPSNLAAELARKSGQTLVGFLRPGRFNVYSGRRRIADKRREPRGIAPR
jgi:FdhD protein